MENKARNISRLFGGNLNVANALGLSPSYTCRWSLPVYKRGNDGLIPAKYQAKLLEYAKTQGIDLRPEDFFYSDRLATIIESNPDKYPRIKRGRRKKSEGAE